MASGNLPVQGWAFSRAGEIVRVELSVDFLPEQTIPCCFERADVEEAIDGAPLETGFSSVVSWERFEPGEHVMSLTACDDAGNCSSEFRAVQTARILPDKVRPRGLSAENAQCELVGPTTFSCTGLEFDDATCEGPITFEWSEGTLSWGVAEGCP